MLHIVFNTTCSREDGNMQISIREPGSAITHFIGWFLTFLASTPILIKAHDNHSTLAISIFVWSMLLLYAASTLYHSVCVPPKILNIFRKLDHMMIFVLIAGSYTPICMIILDKQKGYTLLGLVWSIAIIGMLLKAFWITCPKWLSSTIYIAMGWLCILVFGPLYHTLPIKAFILLLSGGIIYTIGGIIYALKFPLFNLVHKNFGSHEIFHLFVMGGSFCHFVFMYLYVA